MKLCVHYAADISAFSQPHPKSTKIMKTRCTNLKRFDKYLIHIKQSRIFYISHGNFQLCFHTSSFNELLGYSKILKMPQTLSPNEQPKMGCIPIMTMNLSTAPISLKRGMIEAYELTSNLTSCVTLILTGWLECSRSFKIYVLHGTICRLAQSA